MQLQAASKRVQQLVASTDPTLQRQRLHELEQQASTEGFWENQDHAAGVNQEMSDITEALQLASRLQIQLEDVATAVELIDMEVHTSKEHPTCIKVHQALAWFISGLELLADRAA